MFEITGITNEAKQRFFVTIEGYDSAEISLEYRPNQQGWFMSLSWGNFTFKNERVSVAPNFLRQFSNIIPFGLMVWGVSAIDPYTQDSWLSDNKMYLLDANEIEEVEALYVQ